MNLRELARLARLSPAAVSLALRGSGEVSAATRERVRRLADEHGYRPDPAIAEVMRRLRRPADQRRMACFAVISFYDKPHPWEDSRHLTLIYEGMRRRANELGYRLEPLWLRAPGMTYRRFRSILDTRGIEGLLCFGSPDFNQEFPAELDHYAVVTVGLSIRTPLHRVTSHFYNDTVRVLNEVRKLGYRRPGLVVGRYEEARSGHAHTAAYLGWCEHAFGPRQALPVHLDEGGEEGPLLEWLRAQRPDVVILVHLPAILPRIRAALESRRIRVPRDLGIAALSHTLAGTGFSGLEQNQDLMGAWMVELLAGRLASRDLGIPANPRLEMVEGRWVPGRTLRRRRTEQFS
ncbi:MAG TPA: LacI family DNA-binding transcriptional regulator [Opitutaceae bacterium]|nr:LacI family DNA-binding transcriptional regulator [Opitutaceae bacterium]